MKISFYEEFPKKANLEKLRLINFPCRLFIAGKSLEEFKDLERKVCKINKKVRCAYWPIIKNSYWISPFSNTCDLIELFEELEGCENELLVDLEFPLNKKFILKNFLKFFKNKKLIIDFLERNKERVVTAEFPSSILYFFMKFAGLDYNIKTEKSLMWYSSMMPDFMNKNIKKNLIKLKDKDDYSISLGTIDIGILGNESILSYESLRKDLEFVKKAGFNKVIIFRLGGLNKDYINIINKFNLK